MKKEVAVILTAMLLSGCSGLSAISTAADMYQGAKGITTGYHSMQSVKDIAHAKPYFSGYDSALTLAEINPREGNETLPTAFADNLSYQLESSATIMHAKMAVCAQANQCAGRTIIVQFREDAYDRNLLQKVTMGSKVRGRVVYSDAESGKIIGEARIEAADNYYAIAELVSASLSSAMLKSFPPSSSGEGDRIAKELEGTPKVKPIYKDMFAHTS